VKDGRISIDGGSGRVITWKQFDTIDTPPDEIICIRRLSGYPPREPYNPPGAATRPLGPWARFVAKVLGWLICAGSELARPRRNRLSEREQTLDGGHFGGIAGIGDIEQQ
jgi:hypothetical protein